MDQVVLERVVCVVFLDAEHPNTVSGNRKKSERWLTVCTYMILFLTNDIFFMVFEKLKQQLSKADAALE